MLLAVAEVQLTAAPSRKPMGLRHDGVSDRPIRTSDGGGSRWPADVKSMFPGEG